MATIAKWVVLTPNYPILSDFNTTGGQGSPVVIDKRTGIAYTLVGTKIIPISGNGGLNVKWFGAVGDNTTDDSAAFVAAIAMSKSLSHTGTYSNGGPAVYVPASKYYLGSTTLDWDHTFKFYGDGSGDAGGDPTWLRWAANTTGLRLQYFDTNGASGVTIGTPHTEAANSIIEGMTLNGGYVDFVSTPEGEYHGIHLKVRATIRDVVIQYFQGDGLYINADTGDVTGVTRGNANGYYVEKCELAFNRNGMYIKGTDANAGYTAAGTALYNRAWGLAERSFLGSSHYGWQFADNGINDTSVTKYTMVSYLGHRYSVIDGQEVAAATNAPSGIAKDNAYWYYEYDGAPTSTIPAWVSGTLTLRSGGTVVADNNNQGSLFSGFYMEGGEGSGQINGGNSSIAIGGFGNYHPVTCHWLRSNNSGLMSHADFATKNGPITANFDGTGTFGPAGTYLELGADADAIFRIDGPSITPQIQFYSSGTIRSRVYWQSGFGLRLNSDDGLDISFQNASTTICGVNASSFNMVSGKTITVNGVRVVTARQTGWAADTGTSKRTATATYSDTAGAAYAQAQIQTLMDAVKNATQTIKALKDDLIAHGLIGA